MLLFRFREGLVRSVWGRGRACSRAPAVCHGNDDDVRLKEDLCSLGAPIGFEKASRSGLAPWRFVTSSTRSVRQIVNQGAHDSAGSTRQGPSHNDVPPLPP